LVSGEANTGRIPIFPETLRPGARFFARANAMGKDEGRSIKTWKVLETFQVSGNRFPLLIVGDSHPDRSRDKRGVSRNNARPYEFPSFLHSIEAGNV